MARARAIDYDYATTGCRPDRPEASLERAPRGRPAPIRRLLQLRRHRRAHAHVAELGEGVDLVLTETGVRLFREGEPGYDFVVVLRGKVASVEGYGPPEERTLSVHGRGRFLGEISVLTGEAGFVTAVVREPGSVLAVRPDRLRQLVAYDSVLGDLLLRAFMIRRSILIEVGAGFRIIGSCFSPDTRRLREFVARNRLPHRFIDLEEDATAEALLRQLGVKPEETPVVIWRCEELLRNPSNAELARVIGLPAPSTREANFDLLIVGAGPAGQAATSSRIENYLGFPSGVSGGELAERAVLQAEKFGARLNVPATAVALEQVDGNHVVRLDDGSAFRPGRSSSPRGRAIAGSTYRVWRSSKGPASTSPPPRSRRGCVPAIRWPSSAVGTRLVRPRCSSLAGRRASISSSATATSAGTCRATWWTASNAHPTSSSI